ARREKGRPQRPVSLRKRKEVQEMLRCMIAAAALTAAAHAALWPERLGPYERRSTQEVSSPDSAAEENGFESGEQADFGVFQVTAWRYKDPTGAFAASLERNPKPVQVGNYVLACSGNCPKDLTKLAESALPSVSHAALPILADYLPP